MATKQTSYSEVVVNGIKKYQCCLCKRIVGSKHYILHHLHRIHNLSPVKPIYKLHVVDKSVKVPFRTFRRWKQTLSRNVDTNCDKPSNKIQLQSSEKAPSSEKCPDFETSGSLLGSDESVAHVPYTDDDISSESNTSSSEISDISSEISDFNEPMISETSTYKSDESDMSEHSDFHESIKSDTSSNFDSSDTFSDTEISTDDDEHYLSESDRIDEMSDIQPQSLSEMELQALKILSLFQRHNLTTSACRDILQTMKSVFPNSERVEVLDLEYIYSLVDIHPVKEVHYCDRCDEVFPDNLDEFRCRVENCEGFRYKGGLSHQQKNDRQPRKSFILADVKQQLKHLLNTPGILKEVEKRKEEIEGRKSCRNLMDITDGLAYREMLNEDNGFLHSPYNLSAIINTDGVNLYSSSKIELWPIFMAINELSPKARFSRDNMLLVGIWQGKGKPPFKHYMESFSQEMNCLYNEGVEVTSDGCVIVVKLAIICGVFDLPAKAGILNMTYFNGAEACISCEEPGIVVTQGKGTSRCYPYRNVAAQYPIRNTMEVLQHMQNGTEKKRIKGFKGISGLSFLQSFDLVKGVVPDYMHCILLGITNTLLSKWFSPTQSGKDYFIGKEIKTVSERLQNIQPPSYIERLPRDLERHVNNLKATELQAWLLFYALPCLHGILPEVYLIQFSYLSEALYILLGDNILPEQLERATILLDKFYMSFANLYGQGSCGLNVHNACRHMVWYVKLWGPIWAWSCFPFEDNNAMLLKSVHGTGNVMKQIMKYKQAVSCLRRKGVQSGQSTLWKKTAEAANCDVSGKMKHFTVDEIEPEVLVVLGVECTKDLRKVDRIRIGSKQFCSSQYLRMKKRVCNVVLYSENRIGFITQFIYNTLDGIVHTVLKKYERVETRLSHLPSGKHLTAVKATQTLDVVSAEQLIDTLIYIDIHRYPSSALRLTEAYVVAMPNCHGHAIFK